MTLTLGSHGALVIGDAVLGGYANRPLFCPYPVGLSLNSVGRTYVVRFLVPLSKVDSDIEQGSPTGYAAFMNRIRGWAE